MNKKITFKYDLEKEFWNLHAGLNSINHPNEPLSKFAQEMKDGEIDFKNKKQVLEFIQNKIKKIDIQRQISKIENGWQKVEENAIQRMDKIYGWPFDFPNLTAYLTLNPRCAYNPDKNFFFVTMFSPHSKLIILHELMHFYAHKYIEPIFKKKHLSKEQFNDYKEALTVLLNFEFTDLLEDDIDKGYKKQDEFRKFISKNWPKFGNIIDLTKYMVDIW